MNTPIETPDVRLATRASPMALEQTGRFAELFRRCHPDLVLDVVEVVSEGDRHVGPLSRIGGKGAFTRTADRRLLAGEVDMAIACAKDVPGPHDREPGIAVGAVLPREDVRDVLVLPAGHPPATLADLPRGSRVGTSAPRRAALLKALYPALLPVPIRGNADSRLARLDSGALGVDAMIAALAGLGRLGHTGRVSEVLDPARWLPASGAGIVVIEHRGDDKATRDLLAPLTDAPTHALLDAERAALAALGGGCLTAASVHASLDPRTALLTVRAAVLDPGGAGALRATASGAADRAADLGREAGERLLRDGAGRWLDGRP
ncbi:hydroxymethylbilane synthase [Streptomyces subrutilus]|uniref:hydroxymethylbilane synthase n=1 Tax=Streptomyces subrutilus TaxID=36818 RepID=UPI002E127E64|nr:hydroxymethylbilane synthase [Streptomyces subrutilus]